MDVVLASTVSQRHKVFKMRCLKIFWKRLTCKHSFVFKNSILIDAGMRKLVVHECEKCGKEKIYIV